MASLIPESIGQKRNVECYHDKLEYEIELQCAEGKGKLF